VLLLARDDRHVPEIGIVGDLAQAHARFEIEHAQPAFAAEGRRASGLVAPGRQTHRTSRCGILIQPAERRHYRTHEHGAYDYSGNRLAQPSSAGARLGE
jgi:hypothetical protein